MWSLRFGCVVGSLALISVIEQVAQAQFETRAQIPVAQEPTWIVAGDFNRDGKQDVAVVGDQPNTIAISVLIGRGDGTFLPPVDYLVGSSPDSIAVGDVNGDGIADIVVANRRGLSVSVLFGKGDGTFQPAMNSSTPSEPGFLNLGDFDGDGRLDLL